MDTISFTPIGVYIKVDSDTYITTINSGIFITNLDDGWIKIDEGSGDKYAHAQSLYLPKPLMDNRGRYNFKYIDSEIIEVPEDEKAIRDIDDNLKTKISQIKNWCKNAIVGGTDADVLGRGMLHYTLTETQQADIKVLMANIQNGAEAVLWHDDSRVMHEVYTAEQFTALYAVIFSYIIRCKIYSDGLEQLAINLAEATDPNGLDAIYWGQELPEDINTEVETQIALMTTGSAK